VNRRRPQSISPAEILTTLLCVAAIIAAFVFRSSSFTYFVAALTAAGILRSLVPSPIRGFASLMLISVFVILGYFAVSASVRQDAKNASSRARAESTRAYADSLTRWQLTTIIWNQASAKSVGEAASRTKDLSERAEGGSLRRRVLALSSDIYSFLRSRQEGEPPAKADPDQAVRHAQDQIAYMDSTVTIFSRRFGDRVRRAIRDLSEAGRKDPDLERLADRPRNLAAVADVADRLATLGSRTWK
jgi:hypothetical protein